MPKLEIKSKSTLSRAEVAERLIALGQALASGSEVELGSGGDSIEIAVPEQVRWELEIEVDGNEVEIEIEIHWRDDPPAEQLAKSAVPTKAVRRGRPRKSAAK